MNTKTVSVFICLLSFVEYSCDNTIKCERHFFTPNFTGNVEIYYNQENGQKQYDKNGCIVYEIPENGKCLSALPFIEGTSYPGETLRFFERVSGDSLKEIPEFSEHEYLKDTIGNKEKKYVFFVSSGYSKPYYTFQYDVDYGANYKKHNYY